MATTCSKCGKARAKSPALGKCETCLYHEAMQELRPPARDGAPAPVVPLAAARDARAARGQEPGA